MWKHLLKLYSSVQLSSPNTSLTLSCIDRSFPCHQLQLQWPHFCLWAFELVLYTPRALSLWTFLCLECCPHSVCNSTATSLEVFFNHHVKTPSPWVVLWRHSQFLYSIFAIRLSDSPVDSLFQLKHKLNESRRVFPAPGIEVAHSKCFIHTYWIKGHHLHLTLLRISAFLKGTLVNWKLLELMTFHSWW